jgi:hypothetical protein
MLLKKLPQFNCLRKRCASSLGCSISGGALHYKLGQVTVSQIYFDPYKSQGSHLVNVTCTINSCEVVPGYALYSTIMEEQRLVENWPRKIKLPATQ